MELVIIGIAVLTMFVAQRVEHRLGAAAAGWFATLPIAFAVAAVSIAIVNSPADAATAAFSAAGHIAPMITYAVTFTETGLPNGTNWSVTAKGVTHWSGGTAVIARTSLGTWRGEHQQYDQREDAARHHQMNRRRKIFTKGEDVTFAFSRL